MRLSIREPQSLTFLVSITHYYRAILVTYQRLAFPPDDLRDAYGPWYHAVQRCLDACDNMSEVIRALNDADLENVSPHLIHCVFVAARFFLGRFSSPGIWRYRLTSLQFMQRSCQWKFRRG
jgi:hypothetical protein